MTKEDFVDHRVVEHADSWICYGPAGFIEIPRDGRWQFNGDYRRPTFTPSVNETWGKRGQSTADFKADPNPRRSHLHIRDGRVEYLSDCTHPYAGTTHDLEARPVEAYSAWARLHEI